MDNETLAFTPAVELVEMIRTKKLSPVEYMTALLTRIEALNLRVNAFAHLAADAAMDAAKHAEDALMKDQRIGRLHGIPVTIKDLAITKDMPTQMGSNIFAGNQPKEDTPIVPRLRDEGAIILGKTTTSEFGWTGVSHSPLTGITHNPWKHGYNAGASSAGAGAAAAAGFGPLHQGSDGAGSIRMPSHFCGVFGLKPTFGRVPYYPVGSGDYTSHMGPMTRTRRRQRADAGGDGWTAPARPHNLRGRASELPWSAARRHSWQAHRVQPRSRPCARRSRRRRAGEIGGRTLQRTWCHSRGSEDALGRGRPGNDPLLLGGAHDTATAASGEVGSADGPRSRRLHQSRARTTRSPTISSCANARWPMSPRSIAGSRTGISC